jgi:hypothetical protein
LLDVTVKGSARKLPDASLIDTHVSDSHFVIEQLEPPILACMVGLLTAKFLPKRVTDIDPVDGTFCPNSVEPVLLWEPN